MGRHSSPERAPFLRSLGAWALPWLLILGVVAIALMVAFDMVGGDPIRTEDAGGPQAASTANDESDDGSTPAPTESEGSETGEDEGPSEESKDERSEEKAKKDDTKTKLIAEGIEVQVLNGTSDGGVDDAMADKLARLGFTVVAVSPSGRAYPETVVFWTAGSEEAAVALAERFDWDAEPAPGNLSQEVHLHVMVGGDEL